ncbi:MAG: hypothetical protein ACREI3_07960, partial [Nitrospirales bacterium]
MAGFSWGAVLIGLCLAWTTATPHTLAQTGPYLRPALSASEVFDDNIFFASSDGNREHDVITRFTPALEGGYRSTPLTITARYTFDAEIYTEHPELTSPQVRQQGMLEFTSQPNRLLTMKLEGSYFQTRTPFELNLLTGIAIRRTRAERYSVAPSLTYQIDRLTTTSGDYAFNSDRISGGLTIDTHVAHWTLDRRLTRLDTVGPGYTFQQLTFGGVASTTMHAATLGWERAFTPLSRLNLRAGPRLVDGLLDDQPEVEASFRHTLQRGEVSVTYTNTLRSIIGQPGAVQIDSVLGSFLFDVNPRLRVTAGPGFSRTRGSNFTVNV